MKRQFFWLSTRFGEVEEKERKGEKDGEKANPSKERSVQQ